MRVRRLYTVAAVLFLFAVAKPAFALEKYQNWCQQGGQQAQTAGINSSNFIQRSFKTCTITVYSPPGQTSTLATLYSDGSSAPLANPFTNQNTTTGQFFFYAVQGHYDVKMAGTGLTTYTLGDIAIGGTTIDCSAQPGANAGAKIIAAIAAVPVGGTVDCRNLPKTGQTAASTIAIDKPICILFDAISLISTADPVFNFTATDSCIRGMNPEATVITAAGGNAVQFAVYSARGSINVSDISFNGTIATTKNCFYQPGTTSIADETSGVIIANTYCNGFHNAISAKTTRNWWIHDNWFENINSGIVLNGQNLVWRIEANQLVYGSGNGSAAGSAGLNLDYGTYAGPTFSKPEGTQVHMNQFFGFKVYGAACVACLFWNFDKNDIASEGVGVYFSEAAAITNITNNYIEMHESTATQCIYGGPQSSVLTTKINIERNQCITDGNGTTTTGIQLDTAVTQNQAHVRIIGNMLSTFPGIDIVLHNAGDVEVDGNEAYSTGNVTSFYVDETLANQPILIGCMNKFVGAVSVVDSNTRGMVSACTRTMVYGTLTSLWDLGRVFARVSDGVMGQQNGSTAQEFRVYGTTATANKFVGLNHSGVNANLINAADGTLGLGNNGVVRWLISPAASSYAYVPLADNAYDFGTSSLRPRTGIYGTSVQSPLYSNGTGVPTFSLVAPTSCTGGGCSLATGSVNSGGKLTTTTTGAATITINFSVTSTHGPSCLAANETQGTANPVRAVSSTTAVVLTGTTVTGDVLNWFCFLF